MDPPPLYEIPSWSPRKAGLHRPQRRHTRLKRVTSSAAHPFLHGGPQAHLVLLLVVTKPRHDGPSASTAAAGRHTDVDIRVVGLKRNGGRRGALHARGRWLLLADADGARRLVDIELLLDGFDAFSSALCGKRGSKDCDGEPHTPRQDRGGGQDAQSSIDDGTFNEPMHRFVFVDAQQSFLRNFLMYGLHTALRFGGLRHVHDIPGGFKLFSRATARVLFQAYSRSISRRVCSTSSPATLQGASYLRSGGTHDLVRGSLEQAERRDIFVVDDAPVIGAQGKSIIWAVEHVGGRGRETKIESWGAYIKYRI
jgi:hypothetical protein